MAVYTVLEPAGLTGRGEAEAGQIVFIKEGFCWPALLIPVLWLVYHGMWLILLAYVLAATGLELLVGSLTQGAFAALLAGLAFAWLFALEANNLRRAHLERKGYRLVAVTAGRNREECERRFFESWLGSPPHTPGRPAAPAPGRPAPDAGIIGVFPQAGRG